MGDKENVKRPHPPRGNFQYRRPPPGVQKAMQNFGVSDLREYLEQKRQEQGESQGETRPDLRSLKLPPPDPSYNYLKDPTRDTPKHHDKPRHREVYSAQHRHKDNTNLNKENVHHSHEKQQQDNSKESYSNIQEKGVLKKNQTPEQFEGTSSKKELRFSDTTDVVEVPAQLPRGGRSNFRGRNARRGGGMPRKTNEEKIENLVNIKIELSTETGLRNCTLDENTKIPDIKHVSEKNPYQRFPRGNFRGNRGNFRGRGRGRGSFRGNRGHQFRGKGAENKPNFENQDNSSFNMEEVLKSLPSETESTENRNLEFEKQNDQSKKNQYEDINENLEANPQKGDEYDQENEEYNDANDNYDDEYYSEYHDGSAYQDQNLDNSNKYESSPESDKYHQGMTDQFDPNLKGTITITSSRFQDGEVIRSVEVTSKDNVLEKEGNIQEHASDKKENQE